MIQQGEKHYSVIGVHKKRVFMTVSFREQLKIFTNNPVIARIEYVEKKLLLFTSQVVPQEAMTLLGERGPNL